MKHNEVERIQKLLLMKVIWFNGNLGNQIFYCAFKDYLQERFPNEMVYAYIDAKCPPVKIEECTNLKLPAQNIIVTIISFFVFKVIGILFRRIPYKYVPNWYCGKEEQNNSATFIGHSLQEKYYYEQRDSSWLTIKNKSIYTSEYLHYERLIGASEAICVHVRRGDYVKSGSLYADLSSSDYYDKAIQIAKEKYPNGKLFFFSDDLDYVKERFKNEDACFVDCNRGSNSFLDMKLMSLAKVNIMANSTFSYWGAYMGHENKLIIYPKRWFTEASGRKAPNIMLDKSNWISI